MFKTCLTLFLPAILLLNVAKANECKVVSDSEELANIRKETQMFSNYANGWVFAYANKLMCLPEKNDEKTLRCTGLGNSQLVSLNKNSEIVSGIVNANDGFYEFLISANGNFSCTDSMVNVAMLKEKWQPQKEQKKQKEACEMYSDSTSVYQTIGESVEYEKLGAASLYLRMGTLDCEKATSNQLVCLTSDKVDLVFAGTDSPPTGIRTSGLTEVELSFYQSGDSGCAAISELQKYRQ